MPPGRSTAQGKAAAALEIVYDQTADAAGAFGREAGTTAGKLQRSKATFTDMKAEIGQGLAPAFGLAMDAGLALKPVMRFTHIAVQGGDADAVGPLIDELTTLLGILPGESVGLENVGTALANMIPFLGPIQPGHWQHQRVAQSATTPRTATHAVQGMEEPGPTGWRDCKRVSRKLSDGRGESSPTLRGRH